MSLPVVVIAITAAQLVLVVLFSCMPPSLPPGRVRPVMDAKDSAFLGCSLVIAMILSSIGLYYLVDFCHRLRQRFFCKKAVELPAPVRPPPAPVFCLEDIVDPPPRYQDVGSLRGLAPAPAAMARSPLTIGQSRWINAV
ncbi:hypothetical protein XA68_13454 [Ophiocordyceps unilateralis]|uniref:Uncharacterized protein n=1 Tax=Ophiocordyceps unilateralis TaxID=268505 RepID=A0A2A9PCJ8_OPHUN|nr:hypothetical protein XA68_13454 [Ophiocordyceps unilateralis]